MFNFGWAELLIIIALAVLVIGPQEIPQIMRTLGRIVRRAQYIRFALSQQFEDFMQEHDLNELRKGVDLNVIEQSPGEKRDDAS